MTVSTTTPINSYTGNNSTDTYAYSFKVNESTDLRVVETTDAGVESTLVHGVDYTVTVAGDASGGTVVLAAGNLATDYTLVISRAMPLAQTTVLRNQGPYFGKVVEGILDSIVMMIQQVWNGGRLLRLPVSETATDALITLPEDRASAFLAFDADKNLIASDGIPDVPATAFAATLLDDADATEARTTLGATAVGDAIFTAVDEAAARDAMGGLVPVVATIAALKALTGTNLTGYVQVAGYTTAGDGGGGLFRWVAADATADNGGTVIAPTVGDGRFFRVDATALKTREFGMVGDGVTDDTLAWARLIAAAQTIGHDFSIIVQPGVYRMRPDQHYSVDYAWRGVTELVDVYNVSVIGYGATLWVDVPNSWAIGDIANHANEEGPLQFRTASGDGACHDITIKGVRVLGTRLTGGYTSDGGAMGVIFRGVRGTLLDGVKCENWSTDGVYYGKSYSDTYVGSDHQMVACRCSGNMRQGLSVVGNDRGSVTASYFGETSGSSFGHGIDFEPNSGVQYDWTVTGCTFKDNERGALNIIRTQRLVFSGNTLDERYTGASPGAGAIYIDGGHAPGTEVKDIRITENTIIANKSLLYVVGDYIEDVEFSDNIGQCAGEVISGSLLMIRLLNQTGNERWRFRNNKLSGWGGLQLVVNAGLVFEDNEVRVHRNGAATADVFTGGITTAAGAVTPTDCSIRRNKFTIASDVVHAGDRDCYIVHGVVEGNEFTSHANAILSIQDTGAGRTVRIGCNKFSPYFYFNASTSSRDITADMPAYQRAAFTPVIEGSSAAGAGTYTTQVGEYVRVGNLVTFSLSLVWTAHTGTGNIRVAGLPFAADNITGLTFAISIQSNNLVVTAGQVRSGAVGVSDTGFLLLREDPAGGAANLVAMDTAGTLTVSGSYICSGAV